jgi:hypothetical protein
VRGVRAVTRERKLRRQNIPFPGCRLTRRGLFWRWKAVQLARRTVKKMEAKAMVATMEEWMESYPQTVHKPVRDAHSLPRSYPYTGGASTTRAASHLIFPDILSFTSE